MNIVIAVDDVRLRDERIEERDRSLDAIDDELSEGALQPHQTLVAGPRMHDELTDQTVIIRRDGVAGICARIDPDAETAGRMKMGDGARLWPESVWILGIDAAFNGMPIEPHILLAER